MTDNYFTSRNGTKYNYFFVYDDNYEKYKKIIGDSIYASTIKRKEDTNNVGVLDLVESHFFPKSDSYILYIIDEDNTILAFVKGQKGKNNGFNTGKDHIKIEMVEVNKNKRGMGLCKPLMMLYIDLAKKVIKDLRYFELYNAGGIHAFKCYVGAFNESDYDTYYDENYTELIDPKTVINRFSQNKTFTNHYICKIEII